MGVSENRGTQIIHFYRDFHYTPPILGYPYFWKHPYNNLWKKKRCVVPSCSPLGPRNSACKSCSQGLSSYDLLGGGSLMAGYMLEEDSSLVDFFWRCVDYHTQSWSFRGSNEYHICVQWCMYHSSSSHLKVFSNAKSWSFGGYSRFRQASPINTHHSETTKKSMPNPPKQGIEPSHTI